VSAWGVMTDEQYQTQERLVQLGVQIITAHGLDEFDGSKARLSCVYGGQARVIETDAVVLVTARTPVDDLYKETRSWNQKARSPCQHCTKSATAMHRPLSPQRFTRDIVTPGNWKPTWQTLLMSATTSCSIRTELEIRLDDVPIGANNVRTTQKVRILCER